jgi:hypothetical protein
LEWNQACLDASRAVLSDTGEDIPIAYWMAIISGICDKLIKPARSEYDLLRFFLQSTATDDKMKLSDRLQRRLHDLVPQIRRLSHTARHGRFFCTKEGRVGLGPLETKVGDKVCVFYHGFTPFIIRQKEEDTIRFRFIGDSYIHGLVDFGENSYPDEILITPGMDDRDRSLGSSAKSSFTFLISSS